MSIRFVSTLEEEPQHSLVEVGLRIIFTMVNGQVKPCEIIEPDGTEIAIGVPLPA